MLNSLFLNELLGVFFAPPPQKKLYFKFLINRFPIWLEIYKRNTLFLFNLARKKKMISHIILNFIIPKQRNDLEVF